MTGILLSLTSAAAAVWVGAIVFQSGVVAPAVFGHLDATASARLLRTLFPRFFRLGIACGVIVMASLAGVAGVADRPLPGLTAMLFASGAMTLLAAVSLWLVPRINAARDQGENGAAAFQALHRLSVVMTIAVLVAGVGLLSRIGFLAASAVEG